MAGPRRSQLKKTGYGEVSPFYDDMLERAYNNPTNFERNVIKGKIKDEIFDDSMTLVNRGGPALQELSGKRKGNKASKVNLHAERDNIPPGAMKQVLQKKIRGLEDAYLPKKAMKKEKSRPNLGNNLMHVIPPSGEPNMHRMSPIPPNHSNYAFSPR